MFWKRTLPVAIAFIFGIIGISLYYIPHQVAQDGLNTFNGWLRIIQGFALFIGFASLLRLHWTKMKRKSEGWGYSIFVFIGFIVTIGFSLYNEGHYFLESRISDGKVDWIYLNIVYPATSTMFAMLAFFVASAAFRTFRAKSVEAAILLVAAVIVMFGKTPFAAMISDSIPEFAQWLLAVPNLAVKRALYFGICLGSISTSLRIIFGIERSYLGGE